MTIHLHWWLIPILFIVVGKVLADRYGKQEGRYDFFSPLLGAAFFFGGVIAAVAFVIGRWSK